jgi:hypothetical protein
MEAAGLRETSCGSLRRDHRASADEWWSDPASGVAFGGQLVQSRTSRVRTEIKRHFDLLGAEFADEDGVPTLPHAALPARARR